MANKSGDMTLAEAEAQLKCPQQLRVIKLHSVEIELRNLIDQMELDDLAKLYSELVSDHPIIVFDVLDAKQSDCFLHGETVRLVVQASS